MIPKSIVDYLERHGISFSRRIHPRAVSAQQLAASLHKTGYRVAKSVILEAGGQRVIAVLPAAEMLDMDRLANLLGLGLDEIRLLSEGEFEGLFPDCEVGAEPPFGTLYGLPVVADQSLSEDGTVVFRAGSHEEALEIRFEDFVRLESPLLGPIGTLTRPAAWSPSDLQV